MKKITVPIYMPYLKGNEEKYVSDCIKSTWISSRGKYINDFESNFAAYLSVAHTTSVSNGTVALHLALHALGIGPGDEVIVPTLTYIASVNAISYVGATPIFVDSKASTWNMDPLDVKRKLTKRTKAIMVVHLYGNPCAMNDIQKICKENHLFLIEDAAEAFGSKYHGNFVGGFGDFGSFSFFGNKTITTGEGGMLTSNNQKLVERAAYLKSQGVSKTKEYWHDELAFNYRMTNICAAIGLAQLEQADFILRRKREINECYVKWLKNSGLVFQETEENSENSYWMVSVLAPTETIRDGLREHLAHSGIETRPIFYPAHTMPHFRNNNNYPVAENISKRGLNLPSFPDITFDQIEHICRIINNYIKLRHDKF